MADTVVLSFDSYDSQKSTFFSTVSDIYTRFHKKSNHCILVCNVFRNNDPLLYTLSHDAPLLSKDEIKSKLSDIIQTHKATLNIMHTEKKSLYMEKIDDAAQKILSLLLGINLLKEISKKSIHFIYSYMAQITAILIQAHLYETLGIEIEIKKNTELETLTQEDCIIPIYADDAEKDQQISHIVETQKAHSLHLWTHHNGIMTANPKIVSAAFSIKKVDYLSALEIGYLGGKIFHPTAIQQLMHSNIPIYIYSMHNVEEPVSIILDLEQDTSPHCLTITERDKMTVFSIRSTKMFDAHGYLEQLFRIFSTYKVPVETLSTSEISVSLTFPSKHLHPTLIEALSQWGEIDYLNSQTIISLIGESYWKFPSNIAMIFTILSEYQINMLSLGKSGSNLNLVVESSDKIEIINLLHKVLFEA